VVDVEDHGGPVGIGVVGQAGRGQGHESVGAPRLERIEHAVLGARGYVQGATLDGGHERGALGGGKAARDPERVLVVAPPSERPAAVGLDDVGRGDDLGVPGQMLELRRGHAAGLLGDLAPALFRRRFEEAQEGTQLVPAEAALPEGRSRVGQLGQPVGDADHLGGVGVAQAGTEGQPVGHGPGAVGPPPLTAVEGGDQPADRRPQRGLGREQLANGLGEMAAQSGLSLKTRPGRSYFDGHRVPGQPRGVTPCP
jgi:hypothetical protein